MRLVSWNVNGLRAVRKKGFDEYLSHSDADMFCVQETKLQAEQLEPFDSSYHAYFSFAKKKGYSGTGILTRKEPLGVRYGIGHALDDEGRSVTLEYPSFFLVCVYVPNSQMEHARLDLRQDWDKVFLTYLKSLDAFKPVIICGDLNVAHQPIDLKHPKENEDHAGYTKQERDDFSLLLASGFTDSFRHLYPDREHAYSWWSYRFHAREHNAGWRIDYWLVSDRMKSFVNESSIDMQVMGSDHAPVILDIDI